MSPYLRSVECWLCGPVLWCRRCHAVHVLPVPRGRFTTGNLQLFMWRSLGRDNGNIWTQHSQSTYPHTHHFYPELHTHISLTTKCFIILTSLYCWVFREASAGPSIVCPRASARVRVWPPPRPGSGSVGVSPARCPQRRMGRKLRFGELLSLGKWVTQVKNE